MAWGLSGPDLLTTTHDHDLGNAATDTLTFYAPRVGWDTAPGYDTIAQRTFTITLINLPVVTPGPTASNKSGVTASYNAGSNPTTSIDLSANVTNATIVRPVSAPANGTLNVATNTNAAGTTLIYTPAAGYRAHR